MINVEIRMMKKLFRGKTMSTFSPEQNCLAGEIDRLGKAMKDELTKNGETLEAMRLENHIRTLVRLLGVVEMSEVLRLYS
jgi:hypothetical protein